MEDKKNDRDLQTIIDTLRAEISECRAKQAQLLNAAQQWRDIFDNINDIICMTDKEGTILRCNKSMQRHIDRPFAEILGKKVHELLHPDPEQPHRCLLAAVSQSLTREITEYRIKGRCYIVIVDPLFNTDGEYTAIVHAMIDITERTLLSDQLEATNEFLHNIIESTSSISLISTNRENRITYWNKGAEHIFGYRAQEVLGRTIDLIYALDAPEYQALKAARHEVQVNRKDVNCETRQIRKDGSTVWINLTLSPRIGNDNQLLGIIGIGENITERKFAEEENRRLQDILLQSQKMEAIGTLAGGVAHDFNNLLTIIRGNVDLALMNVDEANPLHKDLKEISSATLRASNLTRQLLLFSRKHPVGFTYADINRIVNDLVKMLKRLIGENISINVDLAPHLSAVHADEGNIEQVLTNLVVNARDAMPGGGTLTIRTENVVLDKEECKIIPESYSGKFVRLSVEDTGTGIANEIVPHIFEPFFTTKRPGEGTGLGLSVIYGIIKQHDGWINVYSEPDKGSIFKIYLPATAVGEAKVERNDILPSVRQGQGEEILIVEDEEMICQYTKRALTRNGYVVCDARNAKEADEIFEREGKNLKMVISDMILPDGVGLDIVEEFLAREPGLRVIFTSGYMDDQAHWTIIQNKGYRFLQKPYGANELLLAVRETLDKSN
jgi:PAS domain S-box-containing protein